MPLRAMLAVSIVLAGSGCDYGLLIAGRFVDDAGAPRANVGVAAYEATGWTDVDGLFELRVACDGSVSSAGFTAVGYGGGSEEQDEVLSVHLGYDVPCGVVTTGTFAFWHAAPEPTSDGAGLTWQPTIDVPGTELHYLISNESFEVAYDAGPLTTATIDRRIFQDFDFFVPDVFGVSAEARRVAPTSPIEHVVFERALASLQIEPLVPPSRGAMCRTLDEVELHPCTGTDGDYTSRINVHNLVVDLGAVAAVSSVAFVDPSLYSGSDVVVSIETSVDGEAFVAAGSVQLVYAASRYGELSAVAELPAPVQARYVRTLSWDSTEIGEIGIY